MEGGVCGGQGERSLESHRYVGRRFQGEGGAAAAFVVWFFKGRLKPYPVLWKYIYWPSGGSSFVAEALALAEALEATRQIVARLLYTKRPRVR